MSRSLRVKQNCIEKVRHSLKRNSFRSQRSLSEDIGLALSTVSNFLTGKPVDYNNFEELCRRLALDVNEMADFDFEVSSQTIKKNLASLDTLPSYPNGSVPLGSPFYLERTLLEERIYQEIQKPGALVRIKAPSEMGKTSLLLRIIDHCKSLGYHTVNLNLEQVNQTILSDLTQFLRWFAKNVALGLGLQPNILNKYWDEDLGSKMSCTLYFQEYILKSIDNPLLLALDEMHQIFEHPQVAKDFLPLLRSWYEEAKKMLIWQKLRLIVVHSTEIYVPLQLNQSPFNVGLPICLNHLSLEEVLKLARIYKLNWSGDSEAKQLMDLVSGHPYLVQIALYHISLGEITLAKLLETALTSTGIYHNHLWRHLVILEEQIELTETIHTIMKSPTPVLIAPVLAYKLHSLGLIEHSGDKVIPSCELYRRYFLEMKKGSTINAITEDF